MRCMRSVAIMISQVAVPPAFASTSSKISDLWEVSRNCGCALPPAPNSARVRHMKVGWIYKNGEVIEFPSLTAVIQKDKVWHVSTCAGPQSARDSGRHTQIHHRTERSR